MNLGMGRKTTPYTYQLKRKWIMTKAKGNNCYTDLKIKPKGTVLV